MRLVHWPVLLAVTLLLAGCTGDDTSIPGDGGGFFAPTAGVDVVVRNEGVLSRNVTLEVVGPSGDVVASADPQVPAGEERGGTFTLREQGEVRVVVTAGDYGGGTADGRGDPWSCPGGARMSFTFRLTGDVTAPPAFVEAVCGHG